VKVRITNVDFTLTLTPDFNPDLDPNPNPNPFLVMGPPGCGKSSTWKILQSANNLRNPQNKVKVTDINPKVMPAEDLYGHIDMVHR
jgi:ABC-type transport system involved in cytochrome bd biosynthesis fused ATPase/permease subunit